MDPSLNHKPSHGVMITMKNTQKKTAKGFTLLEVLIAVFIFTIVVVAVVGIFARQSASFRFLQIQQRNIENAQFAMNFVAKTLRTSSLRGDGATLPSDTKLYVLDHSQKLCFRFEFKNGASKPGLYVTSVQPTDENSCSRDSHYSTTPRKGPYRLTTGKVDGHFESLKTSRDIDDDASNGNQLQVGLFTIRMKVDDESASSGSVVIQSTVSLRDYPAELKF